MLSMKIKLNMIRDLVSIKSFENTYMAILKIGSRILNILKKIP